MLDYCFVRVLCLISLLSFNYIVIVSYHNLNRIIYHEAVRNEMVCQIVRGHLKNHKLIRDIADNSLYRSNDLCARNLYSHFHGPTMCFDYFLENFLHSFSNVVYRYHAMLRKGNCQPSRNNRNKNQLRNLHWYPCENMVLMSIRMCTLNHRFYVFKLWENYIIIHS